MPENWWWYIIWLTNQSIIFKWNDEKKKQNRVLNLPNDETVLLDQFSVFVQLKVINLVDWI